MKNILAVAGAVIAIFASLPYIIDIVRGKTKPNLVSWITWTLLLAVASAALFAEHQVQAGLLVLGDGVSCLLVVPFGLKYGTATLDRFDIGCQIATLVGLVLWLVFDSPMIAVVATLAIDVVGSVPTLRHSWSQPNEETASAFLISVVAAVLTLLSLTHYNLSAALYPVYLLILNTALFVTISHGQRVGRVKTPTASE